DKARLLDELSRRAGKATGIDAKIILNALSVREGLGSTGIGHGIAVPHARIEGLQSIFGLFARLERPIDFAAIDNQPTDLVFLLLIPTGAGNEQLAALACVSRRLRDRDVAQRLRGTANDRELYIRLVGPSQARKNASDP
ncbi:MAG: PTS sugar transporter subunit IIA, partial [Acetobacteraceae bacterium]